MRTKIVFLANPNNPTGTYISAEDVARLHAGLPPSVLLIIDAAYAEFVSRNDYEPGAALVDAAFAKGAANVVMLRTFSKIYALGGMRLGWAYCPPSVADVLNRVRAPFNVNAAAQAAGIAALAMSPPSIAAREHNDIWLPWFSRELAALGLTVNSSVGNFVLVRFPAAPAHDANAACAYLQARGILTRKMGAYHLPEWLRTRSGPRTRCGTVVATLRDSSHHDGPAFERVALIGIGLIGSSLARVLRRDRLAGEIVACARNQATRDTALALGLADRATKMPPRRCAAPISWSSPRRSRPMPRSARGSHRHCGRAPSSPMSVRSSRRSSAISSRACLRTSTSSRPPGRRTEHSGPESGFTELFRDRWCILTPLPDTDPAALSDADGAVGAGRDARRHHGPRAS